MVSEFVSGVWMWELMAAVDSNDQEFLAKVRRIGIEPKSLARKLVLVMQREVQEELFFHADPHPANLVIMPNNGICFIDFGAIGRFSTQTRKIFRELQHHMLRGDIGRMVNCALRLAGPLPPMDVETVRVEMEKIYADSGLRHEQQGRRVVGEELGAGVAAFPGGFADNSPCPPASRRFSISGPRLPTTPSSPG